MVFSESHSVLFTSQELLHIYATNTSYHVYLGLAFALFVVTHVTYQKYHRARMEARTLLWQHTFVEPFTYAISSAIVGTQAVLNSKCLSMLLQASLD